MSDLQAIEKRSSDVVLRAERIIVKSQEVYDSTADFLMGIKLLKKEIDGAFDDNISSAHSLHKDLVAKKKTYYAPLESAERTIKGKIRHYEDDMEAKRLKEEAKAREEAHEKEQKERAKLYDKAENKMFDGDVDAAQDLQEQAENVGVVADAVAPTIDRKKGLGIRRNWRWRVVAENKIPREYLTVNSAKIGQIVRAMKQDTNIPGIEAYPEQEYT